MDPLEHPLVIVNPSAGRGRAAGVRHEVEAYWREHGVPATFLAPSSPQEVRLRARDAAMAGYSAVVVLGGDGTLHHVINGVVGTGLPVGVLPAGGGNDLARAVGMPHDPLEAAHLLLSARTRRIDLLRLTDAAGRSCLYAGAGGAGIDAEAARLANTLFRRLPGAARYVAAAVAAFRQARPLEVKLTADGSTPSHLINGKRQGTASAVPKRAGDSGVLTPEGSPRIHPSVYETGSRHFAVYLAAVANTPSYGGGIFIAPQAQIDDGWMDLVMVAPLRWTQLLDGLLLALRSGDIRWPELERMRARKLRLETDRPVLFHGDGEVLGETPVEIEVLPGALEILAPK